MNVVFPSSRSNPERCPVCRGFGFMIADFEARTVLSAVPAPLSLILLDFLDPTPPASSSPPVPREARAGHLFSPARGFAAPRRRASLAVKGRVAQRPGRRSRRDEGAPL